MRPLKSRVPAVTLALIAANLAVAFWAPFSPVATEFAFDPLHPGVLSALTCLFLHDPDNVFHLLGNLVFLAAVGPLVETDLGPWRFLVVYFVSGLVGVLAHWAVAASSGVGAPLIGASSAIAGCVGYCCVRYVRRQVHLAPSLRISVGYVALFWVVLQAVGAFGGLHGGGGGTSYVAHIGGFVGGLALAFVFSAQVAASAEAGRERMQEMSGRSPAAALLAAEEHLKSHGDDPQAMWEKADALHVMGESDQEASALVELARSEIETHRALERLVSISRVGVMSPLERMRFALNESGAVRKAMLESIVREPDTEPERPHALLELAMQADGHERGALLAELEQKYTFHAAAELARARGLIK